MRASFSYCRYRLLFRRPFGTAHGLREGTDSVFIRVEAAGGVGHGEATLPPYLPETQDSVIQRIQAFVDEGPWTVQGALDRLRGTPDPFEGAPSARAALHMALVDHHLKYQAPVNQLNKTTVSKRLVTLMTVGLGALDEVPGKVADTRMAKAIKVKLGGAEDQVLIDVIKSLDNRQLFLDANQALRTVEEALDRIAWAGPDRVLGMEQPFPKDRLDLHAALKAATDVPVYADESIQDLAELEAGFGAFDGVNVKLMKCGGLDRAEAMVARARSFGVKVMLGSMSESALGCTAMARLAELAEVVDLDGPWLLRNDPFSGLAIGPAGELVLPQGPGFGCELLVPLTWTPFGA